MLNYQRVNDFLHHLPTKSDMLQQVGWLGDEDFDNLHKKQMPSELLKRS